jgi:solute:Na+ symporter, SSS family
MHFRLPDILVLATFLVSAAGMGILFSRRSATSYESYFLGSENKWWMLAASGASTNFSVNGTVWNLAILMILGMKSFYVTLVWWMPNAVFLMAYSGIWIRRCGGMTAVELNRVRFGSGTGAKWARSSFAFMIILFSIASLCMSYIIIHKFAVVFGCSNRGAHMIAVATVAATSGYVLLGGFKGVIFSEFLQTVVLFSVAFVIGVVCLRYYSGTNIHEAVASGSGTEAVTTEYWKSLVPKAKPRIGMFADSGYSGWKDFSGMVLAGSIIGMIGCVGGAGGRYGEQRFLATKNTKEAAMMAALWQFLGFPRWVMTGGLCFLAYALFKTQIARDPESAMPLFLGSGLLRPGMLGFVVAGLSASFMTSFCSEINACASIVVRDLYQPLVRPHVPDQSREFIVASYVATGALALVAIFAGYGMVESQNSGNGSALNVIWAWMLGGLLTCLVIPLALRWYWGRMNGWGFAAGCLAGLVPSLMMLARNFTSADGFLASIPVNHFIYTTLAVSAIACIAVTFATPRIEDEVSARFYARVRPFGLWKDAETGARFLGLPMATALSFPLVALNVVIGLVASFSLYMAPIFFFGHWPTDGAVCSAIFVGCTVLLYFTWYKTLPND